MFRLNHCTCYHTCMQSAYDNGISALAHVVRTKAATAPLCHNFRNRWWIMFTLIFHSTKPNRRFWLCVCSQENRTECDIVQKFSLDYKWAFRIEWAAERVGTENIRQTVMAFLKSEHNRAKTNKKKLCQSNQIDINVALLIRSFFELCVEKRALNIMRKSVWKC